jgi:hypothetical protein
MYKFSYSKDIYNDVTAYYNWVGKDIYGIEIYSSEISESERQMFNLLWQQSR